MKDLTDWQFKGQCDIAGLDWFGVPKQVSDEQIRNAQRAMDHENVLTRSRAVGALLRRAEAMSDSPIFPRVLSPRSADGGSPATNPLEAEWNRDEIRKGELLREAGMKYELARSRVHDALGQLLSAEEEHRRACSRMGVEVLKSPHSWEDFRTDAQRMQRFVRLGPRQGTNTVSIEIPAARVRNRRTSQSSRSRPQRTACQGS